MKNATKKATKAAPTKKVTKKAEKPSKVKLPKGFKEPAKIENEGRSLICIRQLENKICNTQIEGAGIEIIAMLASAMSSNPEFATMVTIALSIK